MEDRKDPFWAAKYALRMAHKERSISFHRAMIADGIYWCDICNCKIGEETGELRCYDCGLPYRKIGDCTVSNEVWKKISPTGDEGGILCANCMMRRMAKLNLSGVEAVLWPENFLMTDDA